MAKRPRQIELRFPTAGLVRRFGYQQQAPYTTPDCSNVRPYDTLEGRERGGSRPGIVRAFAAQLGGGKPVQCLQPVTIIGSDGKTSDVSVAITGGVVYYSGAGTFLPLDRAVELNGSTQYLNHIGTAYDPGSGDWTVGCVFFADTMPSENTLFAGGTPGSEQGWWQVFTTTDGKIGIKINDSPAGTLTYISVSTVYSLATWHFLLVKFDRDGQAAIVLDGVAENIGSITAKASSITPGNWYVGRFSSASAGYFDGRMGNVFFCNRLTTTAEDAFLYNGGRGRSWSQLGVAGTDGANLTAAVVKGFFDFDNPAALGKDSTSNNNDLMPQGNPTQANGAASRPSINSSAPVLHASPHHQKLYIADHRPVRLSGTDGTIASGKQLSATSVTDWTKLGIDKTLDVVLLTNTKGGIAQDDVYAITNVAAGYITIDATLTNGACHWELARKIKVFDPVAKTLTPITVTYGIAPLNCPLTCTYRDRLVFAGGNTWYMSRQGDATDWDYAYDPADPGRPVAGTNSDAGFVGEPITALIPHSDDFLIFGCENSIWMLRGDPAWGGQIDALSREVGILGASAWCKLPDGGVVFLGRDGLYGISPGGESYPQSISREFLPQELIDVDAVSNVVSMQYDIRDRGIHLFITPVDGSAGTHWWLDWQSKGLFPVSLPAGQQPYSLCGYAASLGDQKHVLLGGRDGYVRRFSRDATDDDGTPIASYVTFGPIRMGDLGRDGILTALEASLDEQSGTVSWEVLTGETAEAAVSASAKASGTWTAGRNRPRAPRVRDVAMALKLSATSRWAMESAAATLAPAGRTL